MKIIHILLCLLVLSGLSPAWGQDGPESLLTSVFRSQGAIMMLIEPDSGLIVDVNPAAESFYGYPKGELRGLRIQDINMLGPKEVAAERERAKGEKRNYFIFPHRLASGEVRTVEVYSAPVSSAGGKSLLFSIIHDTTGKKLAESELLDYKARLEDLVVERTAEVLSAHERTRLILVAGLLGQSFIIGLLFLNIYRKREARRALLTENTSRRLAEEKLRLANADLTRFAEVSAHHLMEPTRRLTSYTQRLRKDLAPLTDLVAAEEVNTSLGYIERDAARMRSLVRDIQLYLAAGHPRGELGQEDANTVLAGIQQRLAPQLAMQQATLTVAALPPAWLDRSRLIDLFTVLIENAIRHGRPIDPAVPQHIQVSGERVGSLSRYRICDNGPGIPAEYCERVFEIFERLTAGSVNSGTGIGLSIARRIVESRRGRIWIENLPQGGAMVAFELPDGERQ